MKKLFLFLLLMLLLAGCKPVEENTPEPAGLSIEPQLITCPDVGGDYTINVVSPNGAWTASGTESWIRVTPESGEQGTTEIRIKITANKESAESTGAVVFTCGDEKVTLPVTRAAKAAPYLRIVSETEYNTPKEGGTYTVQVESNIKWSASSNAGWAKVDKGVSVNDDRITVTVSAATTPEETTAVLTVKPYGEGEEAGEQTVTITRGSTDATSLSVDQSSIDVPANGSSYTITVTSNAKWHVYKTWDMDWVEFTGATEGENEGSFGISVAPATSLDAVSGVITIEEVRTDNYPSVSVQVAVSREGQPQAELHVTPTSYTAPASGIVFPIEIECNYSWTVSVSAAKYLSLSTTSGDGNAIVNVTVKPATDENEVNVKVFITTSTSFGYEKAVVNITRKGLEPVAPEPDNEPEPRFTAKPFTIGNEKQAYFSPGNLQYQASTNTWRFALRQWSYIGEYNKYISDTYSGWIDLFGWGTGFHPTWSYGYGHSAYYSTFRDWGTNPISNGGNGMRTLTDGEFKYIIGYRDNWEHLRGYGTVNEVPGFILLPDDWELPASLTFKYTKYSESQLAKYSDNVYSAEQWQQMEAAGAVFLPAAGSRYGKQVNTFPNRPTGIYWTAPSESSQESRTVMSFAFWEGLKFDVNTDNTPESGHSVRLIRDVNQQ